MLGGGGGGPGPRGSTEGAATFPLTSVVWWGREGGREGGNEGVRE